MPTSRREFLATSTLAAIAATLGRSRSSFAWPAMQPAQPQPVWAPIRRNVGFFTMQGGTIGYLVSPRATVVVDSQFPASATTFLDGIKEKSAIMPVDLLINTHHHADHTAGNISFKGSVKKVVAHEKAAEHMKNPPGQQPPAAGTTPPELLLPDTTFGEKWSADGGDETMSARFYGRAHTSGDVVVTFERANVAHMGDLMFNQRHPVVDRAAGATLRNWMKVLEAAPKDHDNDTIYIFGHVKTGLPVTGNARDLVMFHDYIGALLGFVERQVKAGKSREEILAMRDPLEGFESFGRFGAPGARDPLTCAFEEVTSG
jgi:glyoxylase-like metal-dependent hydrolase (beta-lactamase superfamily II)